LNSGTRRFKYFDGWHRTCIFVRQIVAGIRSANESWTSGINAMYCRPKCTADIYKARIILVLVNFEATGVHYLPVNLTDVEELGSTHVGSTHALQRPNSGLPKYTAASETVTAALMPWQLSTVVLWNCDPHSDLWCFKPLTLRIREFQVLP
jgi:hypothetical protein